MISSVLYSFILFSMFSFSVIYNQPEGDTVTFTVIYDNYSSSDQYTGDWGFSCLIEGKGKTVLFDTGTKPEIFKKCIKSDPNNYLFHDYLGWTYYRRGMLEKSLKELSRAVGINPFNWLGPSC